MMIALRGSRTLGQLDWLPTLISAGLQAGATTYGAYMQQSIAKMQARTQKEIQERQAAAQAQQAAAEQQAVQAQAQQQTLQPGAPSTILGINRDVFIVGGVVGAVVLGIVAIVVGKSSSPKGQAVSA